jgi:hypothetical protein
MTKKKEKEEKPRKIAADPKMLKRIDTLLSAVDILRQKLSRLHPADPALDVKSLSEMVEGAVLFARLLLDMRDEARKLKPLGVRTYTVREALELVAPRGDDDDDDDAEWGELSRDWTPEEWDHWEKECDELEAKRREVEV